MYIVNILKKKSYSMQYVTITNFMWSENISISCGSNISRTTLLEMLVYGINAKPLCGLRQGLSRTTMPCSFNAPCLCKGYFLPLLLGNCYASCKAPSQVHPSLGSLPSASRWKRLVVPLDVYHLVQRSTIAVTTLGATLCLPSISAPHGA